MAFTQRILQRFWR